MQKTLIKKNKKIVDKPSDADFVGNNAAFTCMECKEVYIVTTCPPYGNLKKGVGERSCPKCGKSTAYIKPDRACIKVADGG